MPDVFISYSRSNKAFAQRVYDWLRQAELTVWIDWHDIAISANWFNDILQNIEAADNIVFILSPDSLISIYCHLELAHARKHNKRLIPVIYKEANQHEFLATIAATPLDKIATDALAGQMILQVAADNYVAIQRHNWLLVTDEDDFDERMKVLVNTIRTDLQHVGQHTRFLIRARLWESKNQQPGYLLSPTEIDEASSWLQQAEAESKEPVPTGLQKSYIRQSRQFHRKKRMSTGIVAAILLVFSLFVGISLAFAFNLLPRPLPICNKAICIAVADFAVLDAGATESTPDNNGTQLAIIIGEQILQRLDETTRPLVGLAAGNLRTITGQTEDEQRAAAKQLAIDTNHHIVIYGTIDNTGQKPEFQPRYYISQSVGDAQELAGSDSFGTPIEIELPIVPGDASQDPDAGNTLLLYTDPEFMGRMNALTTFVIGLGLVKEKRPELALDWLDRARKEPGWYESDEKDRVNEKNEGKEIIYFWMGVAAGQLEGNHPCKIQVPLDSLAETGEYAALDTPVTPFECRLAFFRRALEINPQYVRAEMGIANAYADAATFTILGREVVDCNMYLRAKEAYDDLLPLLDQAEGLENSDLIRLKAYYNIGLVYSEMQLASASDSQSCVQQSNSAPDAIDALLKAVERYPALTEENPEAYQIAANSYYHLGLMYGVLNLYSEANKALDEVITIATRDTFREDWQSIEYAALSQKGNLRLKQAQEGDLSLLDEAITHFTQVIEAYPELFADEVVVNQSLFNRALAYEIAGNSDSATADYCTLLQRDLLPKLRKQLLDKVDAVLCDSP